MAAPHSRREETALPVDITTESVLLGDMDGYVARPVGTASGRVLVGMEIFGLTAHVRDACDRLARAGYVALAPNVFWRSGLRTPLGYDEAGRAEGRRLMTSLRRDDVLADVAAAREAVAGYPASGRLGFVGFSLGGHIAVLAATRPGLALSASLYGGWLVYGGIPLAEPTPPIAAAATIAENGTHLLGIVGDQDFLITPEEWAEFGDRLTAAGVGHELHSFAGAGHGFCCPDRPETYHAAAAERAWRLVLDALREHVSG